LAAASSACASGTVIQSVAAGMAQSALGLPALVEDDPVDDEPVGFDVDPVVDAFEGSPEPSPDAVAVPAPTPSDDAPSPPDPSPLVSAAAPTRVPARRSFLAQPDPLKWTAGAAMALRTGPAPHSGQDAGGSAWTPWMTSNLRPQAAQS
jgi:hypothetical protein